MFLKSITLHGFKSFADLTHLDLRPGVTTVVGPNGCGKSNIMDAIRWVLGEQSAKALRGGKMQDVIFAGTEFRKSLPFSEVKLLFSDCEKELGTQFHEVEILRRVTREGGSDYCINGKPCRLKDIQSLFMDTGIGQVSYSFLVQGQVDQILSSNPVERRSIFEEAAGITKYKSQRKESLNKLGLVEVNLTRVTDILDEVSKRMSTLKRQASKALRYQRQKHRLDHLEIAWNAWQYRNLTSESGDFRDRVIEAEVVVRQLKEAIAVEFRKSEEMKRRRQEAQGTLDEKRSQLYTLRSRRQNVLSQCELRNTRIEHLEGRLLQIEGELRLLREQEAECGEGDGEAQERIERARVGVAQLASRLAEQEQGVQVLDQDLASAVRLLQEYRQQLIGAENQVSQFRAACTRHEVGIESHQSKNEGLQESCHRYDTEVQSHQKRADEISAILERKSGELGEVSGRVSEVRERIAVLEADHRSELAAFGEVEKRHTHLMAESSILEGLQKKLEGFAEGTRALMAGKLGSVVDKGLLELFSKQIRVESGYEIAGETILGPLTEALVLASDRVDIGLLADALHDQQLGRATLVLPWLNRSSPVQRQCPEGLRSAGEIILAREPRYQVLVDHLLAGCYVSETLADAMAVVTSHAGFSYERIVTLRGEVMTLGGVVHLGSGGQAGSGFLQRENALRGIAVDVEAIEEDMRARSLRMDQTQGRLEETRAELDERRDIYATIEREISNLRTELQGNERNLRVAVERRDSYRRQLEQLDLERSRSIEALSEARERLAAADARIEELKDRIVEAEREVSDLRLKREASLHGVSDLKVEHAEARQALQGLEHGIAENARRLRDIRSRQLQFEAESEEARETTRILKAEIVEDQDQAAGLEEQEASFTEHLVDCELQLKELEVSVAGIDARGRELIDREREEQSRLQEMQLSLSQKDIFANTIKEKMQAEHQIDILSSSWRLQYWRAGQQVLSGVDIGDMDEETDLDDAVSRESGLREPTEADLESVIEPDWNDVQQEVQLLRTKLNAMGPVNLVAIEEYSDLKQRYDFLKKQSDDLWQSKNKLIAAIDEINKTSEALFKETFEKIRDNFKETFHRLTGGGESDLVMVEGEDVLDCGIDIIARPPGTRLRSLSLLSGGQKTMTAVALLFAIYMVKPSPFCVLDELDAPLDDANIGRFVEMLKDFTRFSQFLIISHNKRTMAASDSLFGVTMEEKGVSKILSMRFNSEDDLVAKMAETATVGA